MAATDPSNSQTAFSAQIPHRKWQRLTQAQQDELIRLLETATAHSLADACALVMVPLNMVTGWLARGARDQRYYIRALGIDAGMKAFNKKLRYRMFFLRVQQARARGASLANAVMTEAALGPLRDVKDPETGEIRQVRDPGDWRAADALAKRQERMDLHADRKRVLVAQADKEHHAARAAEELARRAKYDADRARVLAEAAEKASKADLAAVVFAPTMLAALEARDPELHAKLLATMPELGFRLATQDQAERATQNRDPAKDAALEALASSWGMSAASPGAGIDDLPDTTDPSDALA